MSDQEMSKEQIQIMLEWKAWNRETLERYGFVFSSPHNFRFPLEERVVAAHNAWIEYRDEMNELFKELGRVIDIEWGDE